MNSEEEIARAAESLVSTLKRLHEELLGFDALLQEQGRSIYDVMALEELVRHYWCAVELGRTVWSYRKAVLRNPFSGEVFLAWPQPNG